MYLILVLSHTLTPIPASCFVGIRLHVHVLLHVSLYPIYSELNAVYRRQHTVHTIFDKVGSLCILHMHRYMFSEAREIDTITILYMYRSLS